ncbi:hypothetical protein BKA65DRAFT_273834 [Rhexocercosporidium sp. MPI-PUGE-AT-0058]|nr:hypothetical protein BKA65DRAFT_273834 [Rhexocercosporidium sp. MPI-PUGE-AT-0058]
MAEALGVAASVSGLITIADIVVRRGYAFIKEVREAEESVRKLFLEVNLLFGILHSLHFVVQQLEEDASSLDPTMQIHWIEPCYKTLLKVQELLNKAVAGNSMTNTEKMKWPLRKSATKELLAEIERHKLTVTLALSAREMSALCQIRDGVYTIKAALDSDQAERKKIFIDNKRHEMLRLLGSINARNWQDSNIRLRQLGTGIWFTEGSDFVEWLSQKRSKLWINGIPGAGKTILMSSTIQKIESGLQETEALAFFYCDYKDNSTQNASAILGSLAKQLIMRHEDCFDDLKAFYDDHICPDQSIRTPSPQDLCQLIVKVSAHFDTVMIVVDGLDEILHGRAEVSKLLAALNGASEFIKTILSSRPEVDIGHVLTDYHTISIAAQSSDIRLYIASEIEQRIHDGRLEINEPNLKEHIMTTLAQRCDGMFRWVACQMDYLCECSTDKDRREALMKLPPDLPSSYERILERVNRSTPENQRLVKSTLHWIVYAREPLDTQQLLQALAVREGDTAFDSNGMTTVKQLRHWCSSLVRKNHVLDRLELAHFTVEEFLLGIDPLGSPAFLQYRLSGDHSILAMACIGLLRCEMFDRHRVLSFRSKEGYFMVGYDRDMSIVNDQFLAKYPFFAYVATKWFHHVHQCGDRHVNESVLQLFKSQQDTVFKRMTAAWDYCSSRDPGRYLERDKITGYENEPSPLHWAACFALDRVCTDLLKRGAEVDKQSAFGTPLICSILTISAEKPWKDMLGTDFDHATQEMATWHARARDATVKAILDAGACINTSTRDGSLSALDLAVQFDSVIKNSLFMATLRILRAGALVSGEVIRILTFYWHNMVSPNFEQSWFLKYSEVFQATIEAAVHSDWHSWEATNLACFFGVVFSSSMIPTEDHVNRLSMAFEKDFSEATALDLKSLLHDKDKAPYMQVASSVLKAFECSCETSEAFNHKIWQVLSELLNLGSGILPKFVLILSLCPRLDVNKQDEKTGRTFLHRVLQYDCFREEDVVSAVEILIKSKASIFTEICTGVSPVDLAYEDWDLDINKLLWRSTDPTNLGGASLELLHRTLYKAVSRLDVKMVNFLVQEVIAGQQYAGLSFFAFVLRQDDIKSLDLILAEYFKVPTALDIIRSSLYLAIYSEISIEVFRSLLASRNIGYMQDKHGNTPIHYLTCLHDDLAMAKLQLLIESGLPFDNLNKEILTPLGRAVRCKNLRATRILLDAGADVDIPLARGLTVLQLANSLRNIEAANMISEKIAYRDLRDDHPKDPEQLALASTSDKIGSPLQRMEYSQGPAEVFENNLERLKSSSEPPRISW